MGSIYDTSFPCRQPLYFLVGSIYECTEKTILEEWGEVYVGVQAQPAPPHIPVLFSRLTFFQWS